MIIISLTLTALCWFAQPASTQDPSIVDTFLNAVEDAAEDVIKYIPDWHQYKFSDGDMTSIRNTELFVAGNRISVNDVIPTRQMESYNNRNYRAVQYNTTYRYNNPSFDFGSRQIHPFVAMVWVKGQLEHKSNYMFTVEGIPQGSGHVLSRNNSSFSSAGVNVKYHWFQVYRNTSFPSLCEVYFLVEGETWKSTSGSLEVTDTSFNDYYSTTASISGTPQNVLMGYMLLSRKEGRHFDEEILNRTLEIILDSFPRVLCNPIQTPCAPEEFDCRCGGDLYRDTYPELHCIPQSWRCDGVSDCPDGRDEIDCICDNGFFQCGCSLGGSCPDSFKCISNSKLCDGVKDCENFKDEEVNECAFNCSSEETIRTSQQCDGIIDCLNGSDEWNCSKCPLHLPYRCACSNPNDFSCEGKYSCYHTSERCNGIKSCSDFSDEWNCSSCPENFPFRCDCNKLSSFKCRGIYACFNQSGTCDVTNHCSDGSDEAGCIGRPCPVEKANFCECNMYRNYSCQGDPCYSDADKCDGWVDCSDGSDEKNCSQVCSHNSFQPCGCNQEDGICLPVVLKHTSKTYFAFALTCFSEWDECDTVSDCNDKKDEECQNCPQVRPNECACKGQNNCPTAAPRCYFEEERCDAIMQCSDGSDEWHCNCSSTNESLRCACKDVESSDVCIGEQSCYSMEGQCDGVQHCRDWGDERECPHCPDALNWRCHCNVYGNVTCLGQPCIAAEDVCDGVAQCSDRSDEENCSSCTVSRPNKCACNKVGNFTCNGTPSCYGELDSCDGHNDCGDWSDEQNCEGCPQSRPFMCECKSGPCNIGPPCYRSEDACDGVDNCFERTDEKNCSGCTKLRPNRCNCKGDSTCVDVLPCYRVEDECDGVKDCADGSDEWNCKCEELSCHCSTHQNSDVCVERPCYKTEELCDGVVNCMDGSDEWNCTCPKTTPFKCACRSFQNSEVCTRDRSCFRKDGKCNTVEDCLDGSDEQSCSCPLDRFRCNCFSKDNPACSFSKGCISMMKKNDGKLDCSDGSDEPHVKSINYEMCGACELTIFRLDNSASCAIIGYPSCDNTTCINVPARSCTYDNNCTEKDALCTSACNSTEDCTTLFQCQDQNVIIGSRFCNGVPECRDGSDEIRNSFGFKCRSSEDFSFSCVLPQWNLFDKISQCYDGVDQCLEKGFSGCFLCLDRKMVISRSQVCDGTIDCLDASDECLCTGSLKSSFCLEMFLNEDPVSLTCGQKNLNCLNFTSSLLSVVSCDTSRPSESNATVTLVDNALQIECPTKFGVVTATKCDQRPECLNFEDECETCEEKPAFCDDLCHLFYRMGDRYCDGIEDEAYRYLNKDNCQKGFDEKYCPRRYRCNARNQISIDVSLVYDGIRNCDDGSDEISFSSDEEMIKQPIIRYFIWVIAIITLLGNTFVIAATAKTLKDVELKKNSRCNYYIIINLAFADLLMGIYLLLISIKSALFSSRYGEFDLSWRTGFLCTFAGNLAIISSETSCFLMSVLTTFRLFNLFFPMKLLHSPAWPWSVMIICVWILSILLAVIPSLGVFSDYFISSAWLDSPFTNTTAITKEEIVTVACRHSTLTNSSFDLAESTWSQITTYFLQKLPQYSITKLGYYGENSLCMPRFYVNYGDTAWLYSTLLIALNFVTFVYVCIGYIAIYKASTNRPVVRSNRASENQNVKMQKRIARLLVTDFICWIPICVTAFYKLATGANLPFEVYAITVAFLLPINSALNPLLYSSIFDKFMEIVCTKKKIVMKSNDASTAKARSHNEFSLQKTSRCSHVPKVQD